MARDDAYRKAEKKIAKALRTGATELVLSCEWNAKDSEKLTELPESLGQLTQMQTLEIYGNQLTSLPEWLGQLTQLKALKLVDNQLRSLPLSLGQLTQLQTLYLSRNQLKGLPKSLSQLALSQTLDLSRNRLTLLPEWLGQLSQLQTLDLNWNDLSTLPDSFSQCTNLRAISVVGVPSCCRTLAESVAQNTLIAVADITSRGERRFLSIARLEVQPELRSLRPATPIRP